MSTMHAKDDSAPGESKRPQAVTPVSPPNGVSNRSRTPMCGMGAGGRGGFVSIGLAVVVGVALGALAFGGGASGAAVSALFGSWALLFLLPCLIMAGMMVMMGKNSGSNASKSNPGEDRH